MKRALSSARLVVLGASVVLGVSAVLGPSVALADTPASVRRPAGVYVKLDIETAIADYINSATPPLTPTAAQTHAYLRNLYATLFTDPAISGMIVGAHWDNIQFAQGTAPSAYDWSYLDDVFDTATAAHKNVQLNITPGVDSPPWLFAQLSSCDTLFNKSATAPLDCGKATFNGFPEQQRADTKTIPLPWNIGYQQAWYAFLAQVNARYTANPAFVAIALTGPVVASNEIIFPTTENTTATQPSGLAPDATWAALIQHSFPGNASYQNTLQAFIDAWKEAIDAYERIFSGITFFIGADAGNDLPTLGPNVTPHPDNNLFQVDCATSIAGQKPDLMSCEAKAEILSYFLAVSGPNAKASQVGGMTASSAETPGDIGIAGVKVITGLSPQPSPAFLGGAEFDHPVSGGNQQQEGCPKYPNVCPVLSLEEAAYNALTVFFYGTPAATFYGGTPGPAPVHYLEVPYNDVQWAESHPCPEAPSPIIGNLSLQDLLDRASYDLALMNGQPVALPALTCSTLTTPPTIGFVANAEGESLTIAPNTWVEIKGSNLAPVGDSRTWQGPDFTGTQMPTRLDKVGATVNGKNAYVYYISPTQINILTPPDALSGPVQIVVTNNGTQAAAYNVDSQTLSSSFFVFNGGPYLAATHLNGTLIGPATLFPGSTTPAKPGETVVLYANGFGTTSTPIVKGSEIQSGVLSPLPVVKIGGVNAIVGFAGLVAPGEFQFNVTIPPTLSNGDQSIVATYGGVSTQSSTLITIHN